jgi:hypothetical protein
VVATSQVVNLNGMATATLSLACPAGHRAIGGGFDASGTSLPLQFLGSVPFSADTWQIKIRLNQVAAVQYTVRLYAVCVAN